MGASIPSSDCDPSRIDQTAAWVMKTVSIGELVLAGMKKAKIPGFVRNPGFAKK
jgi:hypothetical protein